MRSSKKATDTAEAVAWDDEPSPFRVWAAVTSSLARWASAGGRRRRSSGQPPPESRAVCYGALGCYRDEQGQLNALPEDPGSIGTRFYLTTRRSREPRLLADAAPSGFDATKPVKLVIHGFGSSGKRSWVRRMVDALLAAGDFNVLVVDWEKGATLPNYVQAAANARLVGRQVAQAIRGLMRLGARPKDFHLVGFSLGAHVAGFAGSELANISRITGGHWQSLCHHRRALQLFIESASPRCPFPAFSCESYESFLTGDCFPCERPSECSYMGYFSDRSKARGKMFLMTRQEPPFCGNKIDVEFVSTPANQYKIIVNSSAGLDPTWGKLELVLYAESGANESFSITSDAQELRGGQASKALVAAHPAVVNITRAVIKYTKYRGWIYEGKDAWFLDKVSVLDSFGYTLSRVANARRRSSAKCGCSEMFFPPDCSVSFCGLRTRLPDGRPVKLRVQPEDCQPEPLTQRVARLVWQVVGQPVLGTRPRPPRLVWTLQLDNAGRPTAQLLAH
ncbi:lipase, putative [Ixodes scapularis]|uniref:Lipase, putative n=1 Tax=Ixodes scapularis TaxID=6945 RepID=B7Q0Y0_IXOSC|nr:lipase, putative [Ixodes scapularis]|eukprot:XP_002408649.1 lipase, putative [Ixodes scapularis]